VYANRNRLSNFAVSQQFDPIADFFEQPGTDEIERADLRLPIRSRRKPVQITDVDDREFFLEYIGEAAFGNSALKRHLAAFEPGGGTAAGAGFLSLGAPSAGHPLAGTRTPAEAFCIFLCSWRRSQLSESHLKIPLKGKQKLKIRSISFKNYFSSILTR